MGLEWSPPADTGGRNDVTYRIICRRCGWEPEECAACGANVGYYPQQAGLADTYVTVVDLLAHANYTFEVEAVNGVSDMSRTQRLFAAVTIATGQAGRRTLCLFLSWFVPSSCSAFLDVLFEWRLPNINPKWLRFTLLSG